jgi:hypothetical protein
MPRAPQAGGNGFPAFWKKMAQSAYAAGRLSVFLQPLADAIVTGQSRKFRSFSSLPTPFDCSGATAA